MTEIVFARGDARRMFDALCAVDAWLHEGARERFNGFGLPRMRSIVATAILSVCASGIAAPRPPDDGHPPDNGRVKA